MQSMERIQDQLNMDSLNVNSDQNKLISDLFKDRITLDDKARVRNIKYGSSNYNKYLPNLNQFEKGEKVNPMKYIPSAETLKKMTPQEKQDLFTTLKKIEKRNDDIDGADPEKVVDGVYKGEINPCEIPRIKYELQRKKEGKKVLSPIKVRAVDKLETMV